MYPIAHHVQAAILHKRKKKKSTVVKVCNYPKIIVIDIKFS